MELGQTAQIPLTRKPLGREEQAVQIPAVLKANPCLQTQLLPTCSWLGPQALQLDPSAVGFDPAGQI
jgi:hypothetical protein